MRPEKQSWRVTYQRTIEYEIENSPDLFDPCNTALLYPGVDENIRRFVVIDNNVEKYYSSDIKKYFIHHGVDAKLVTFPSNEEEKTFHEGLEQCRDN